MPPGRLPLGFPGMSYWEETPGQTQNPLGIIHLLWPGNASVLSLIVVAGEKEAWGALLSRLPPQPDPG